MIHEGPSNCDDARVREGLVEQGARERFSRLKWIQGFLVGSVLVLGALGVFLAVVAHK